MVKKITSKKKRKLAATSKTRAIKSFKVERTHWIGKEEEVDKDRIWKYIRPSRKPFKPQRRIGQEMMESLRMAKRIELVDKLLDSDEWLTADEFDLGPIVEIGGEMKSFKIRVSKEGKIWFIINNEEIFKVDLEKNEFIDLLRMMLAILTRSDSEIDPFDDFAITQR